MISRAAADNIDFRDIFYLVRSEFHVVEDDFVALYARKHRRKRPRLLVNFFQHKVRVTVLFGGCFVPVDGDDFVLDFFHIAVENIHRIGGDAYDFALAEQNKTACMAEKRGHIAGDEVLAVAQTHYERTVLSDRVKSLGSAAIQHAERVRTH